MGNEYGVCEEVIQPKDCIHRHEDGSWWFFDETMAYEHGPFDSEETAGEHLGKYIEAFGLSNHKILEHVSTEKI